MEAQCVEPGDIPVANPAVIARAGPADSLVLVNCDTGAALALNSTGTAIWHLIDGKSPSGVIAAGVSRRFRLVPESVSEDVQKLLGILAEEGFIGYEIMPSGTGE